MQIQHLQKKFPLIIAIAFGILAIVLLNIYLKQKEADLLVKVKEAVQRGGIQGAGGQAQQIGVVLLAQKDIPVQTPITPSDLMIKEVPVEYIQPGAVASLDQVIGQLAIAPITAGEQILSTKISSPGKIGKTLSDITPEGKRAITASIDDFSSIAGLISPGDHVDVFAFITAPQGEGGSSVPGIDTSSPRLVSLFQDVTVLAVGGEFTMIAKNEQPAKVGGTTAGMGTVTFALSPQEAVLLTFVQEHGKIKLVLRSSQDIKTEEVKPADWDSLFQYLYPSAKKASTSEEKEDVVEIFHGLRKEVVPLRDK
ncbi:MAG: Flp pilus assembly protein CpaB [Candidatus Omnitrophica bacterium]|nr:Flp pilus assembly protein CpaB [Candidatus Omnitrophota bacterium]